MNKKRITFGKFITSKEVRPYLILFALGLVVASLSELLKQFGRFASILSLLAGTAMCMIACSKIRELIPRD